MAIIIHYPVEQVSRLDSETGLIHLAPGDIVRASNGLSVMNSSDKWQTFSMLKVGEIGVCFRFASMTAEQFAEAKILDAALFDLQWGGKAP